MVPIRTIERIRIVIVVIPLFKTEGSNHTRYPLGHITLFPFLNATTLLESDGLSHAWHPPRISIQDQIPHVHVDTTVRTPAAPWMSSLHVQPPVVSPRAAVESMKVLRLARRSGRLRRTLVVWGRRDGCNPIYALATGSRVRMWLRRVRHRRAAVQSPLAASLRDAPKTLSNAGGAGLRADWRTIRPTVSCSIV